MPTTAFQTYDNSRLEALWGRPDAAYHTFAFKPSQTIPKGTILGQVTASGLYAIYNVANSDGTEVARAICQYNVVVDANGLITKGDASTTDFGGTGRASTPIYISGAFDTTKLNVNGTPGVTAAVVNDLKGRLLSGAAATSGTSGILVF